METKRDGQPQSVYLKSAHREMAKQLGNGNVSDGIRIALEAADERRVEPQTYHKGDDDAGI